MIHTKLKKNPVQFRWECHHDRGTGQDRECCCAKGHWTTNLDSAIRKGRQHNETHTWKGWGYAPLGWKNQTVNVYARRKGARTKGLRDGDVVIVEFDKLNTIKY